MHTHTGNHNMALSTSSKSSRRTGDSADSFTSAHSAFTSAYEDPELSSLQSFQYATPSKNAKSPIISYDTDSLFATPPDGRSSISSYASTAASTEDVFEEPEEYGHSHIQFDVPDYGLGHVDTETRVSTPQDFAEYFPSQRKMAVRHDDSTSDGNMNLRIHTEVRDVEGKALVQLFHLRMHDLPSRQFSLRRYGRDSGREVCHSSLQHPKPASQRPGLQRSMSSAFASLRHKPEVKRSNSSSSAKSSPLRQDSGYYSNDDGEYSPEEDVTSFLSTENNMSSPQKPTNTMKLEFSNYAQVSLKRRGAKGSKHYEFEYWGSKYNWKRVTTSNMTGKSISYHLIKEGSGSAIAHIVPEPRSTSQVRREQLAGGWVPPCSMWISEPNVLTKDTDVADVIIATGIMSLVDDSIRRHFGPAPRPKPARHVSVEFMGPKAIFEQVFRRRNSAEREKDIHAHKQSPLRHASPVGA